jgi:hypothetical protein
MHNYTLYYKEALNWGLQLPGNCSYLQQQGNLPADIPEKGTANSPIQIANVYSIFMGIVYDMMV